MQGRLTGRRIAVLAADGFEKVELTLPVAALRAARAEVEIVSLRPGRIRGVDQLEPRLRVAVGRTVQQAEVDAYDALLVPGGSVSGDLLRQSEAAREFVRRFDAAGKPIAALCHGPWVLASAELTAGRRLTSWPGIQQQLVDTGATWLDEPLVRDGNVLTGRGRGDLGRFVEAMLEHFAVGVPGAAAVQPSPVDEVARGGSPREIALGVAQWLPRPTLRVAALIGALLMIYALRSRWRGRAAAT